MSGLYFHIPFCKQRCSYCDFHFSTNRKYQNQMIDAICKEIVLRKAEISSPIETIYFGGGTPSLLTQAQLQSIFEVLQNEFDLSPLQEVTLEANPDDLHTAFIRQLKNSPINRFSIGIQSFFDEDLAYMNRAHKANEALNAIKKVQDAGFENITIDLIYGAPTTTDEMWQQNLDFAIDLGIPHISSYALTVEPKTALEYRIRNRLSLAIDEEQQNRQFSMLQKTLKENAYEHYEISNFAKAGFQALHNGNYWKGKPYFGFGPSAHSFDGKCRKWNIANNAKYMKTIATESLPNKVELLSEVERYNEYIMISLRTNRGIDEDFVYANFPAYIVEEYNKEKTKLLNEKIIVQQAQFVRILEENRFYTDGIAASLFYV
ncbi:radical SAM family heme chaperone HemW [Vaginella massiliensis]|uniref:radical SAM family heme chaperone HemW n=1 Tax=Vaginella massiliensis TaxID=1816680 RepID=UPI0008397E11|nr:radical SAM family heme chaperone HemW [Vaginella massiliensis]